MRWSQALFLSAMLTLMLTALTSTSTTPTGAIVGVQRTDIPGWVFLIPSVLVLGMATALTREERKKRIGTEYKDDMRGAMRRAWDYGLGDLFDSIPFARRKRKERQAEEEKLRNPEYRIPLTSDIEQLLAHPDREVRETVLGAVDEFQRAYMKAKEAVDDREEHWREQHRMDADEHLRVATENAAKTVLSAKQIHTLTDAVQRELGLTEGFAEKMRIHRELNEAYARAMLITASDKDDWTLSDQALSFAIKTKEKAEKEIKQRGLPYKEYYTEIASVDFAIQQAAKNIVEPLIDEALGYARHATADLDVGSDCVRKASERVTRAKKFVENHHIEDRSLTTLLKRADEMVEVAGKSVLEEFQSHIRTDAEHGVWRPEMVRQYLATARDSEAALDFTREMSREMAKTGVPASFYLMDIIDIPKEKIKVSYSDPEIQKKALKDKVIEVLAKVKTDPDDDRLVDVMDELYGHTALYEALGTERGRRLMKQVNEDITRTRVDTLLTKIGFRTWQTPLSQLDDMQRVLRKYASTDITSDEYAAHFHPIIAKVSEEIDTTLRTAEQRRDRRAVDQAEYLVKVYTGLQANPHQQIPLAIPRVKEFQGRLERLKKAA